MSDVTTEQKLRLVQQIRARYHENQYDMSNRERIMYGKTSILPEKQNVRNPYEDNYRDLEDPDAPAATSFKLRFMAAAFLLVCVILMDKNNIAVGGIKAEKIFQTISASYEDKIESWIETLSR